MKRSPHGAQSELQQSTSPRRLKRPRISDRTSVFGALRVRAPRRAGVFDPGRAGIFDPGRAGVFDPGRAGVFDPGRAGVFDPGRAGVFDPRRAGIFDWLTARLYQRAATRRQDLNAIGSNEQDNGRSSHGEAPLGDF